MSDKREREKLTVVAVPTKTHKRFKNVVDRQGRKMGSAAAEALDAWVDKQTAVATN